MLFNSYPFIFLFLPVALAGYFGSSRLGHLAPAVWLALASLAFYSVSNWQFVLLLLASVAFNYTIGWLLIAKPLRAVQRFAVLAVGVAGDLLVLGYFKYAGFLAANLNAIFSTYNCVNTLPYVTELYETYKDKGLVVVGIHTPEFPFERSAGNVQAALKRRGITYPVAQDNELATWNAWRNQYWPAQYIVDQRGNVVFNHAGEGQYDEIERTVRRLLNATS